MMNSYEAYVYKITVKNIEKIYIGYHVGHEQDPYVHSSTDEQMKIDMRKHDFNYEIIERGTKQNMANLEHKLLTEVDAKNNPKIFDRLKILDPTIKDLVKVTKKVIKEIGPK